MHLASIFFCLFQLVNNESDLEATKNTGYQLVQLFRRKFLVISCETHPLKIIISPQLGKMLHHEIREKNMYGEPLHIDLLHHQDYRRTFTNSHT